MGGEEGSGPMAERPSSVRYEPSSIDLANRNDSHTLIVELVGTGNLVLEVGTSTGYLTRVLRDLGNRVIGIEVDGEAAKIAEEHCDLMIPGDMEEIDLEDYLAPASIDVAVFGDVLEHLKYPAAVLKKVRRYLKPHGSVVVSIPNVCHGDVLINLLNGEFRYTSMGLLDETHLRFFGLKNVLDLLAGSGYSIEEVRTTRHPVGGTELRRSPEEVPAEIRRLIEALPNSDVYQFVLLARPSDDPKSPPVPIADLKGIFDRSVEPLLREREEPLRREVADAMAKSQEASEQLETLKEELERSRERGQSLELAVSERDCRIAELSCELAEAGERAKSLDQAASERDGRIAELSEEVEEARAQARSLELAVSERNMKIADADDHLRSSEIRTQQLENEIAEIKRSIIWQLTMKYHNCIVERGLPQGTRRRNMYNLGIESSRALINDGFGSFSNTFGHYIKFNNYKIKMHRNRYNFLYESNKTASICIVNYNGIKYLKECLESIRQLNYPKDQYEIIVVDNMSTDGSCELIESYYNEVNLIKSDKNLGFAGGCNLGMKHSKGEYLVMLNNDSVVDCNWLGELIKIAEDNKDVAIVGSKILFKYNPNIINNAGSYITTNGDGGDVGFGHTDVGQYDTVRDVLSVCGASALIKRELIEEIGGFDDDFFMYYEDTDLCYRTKLYGKRIVYNPRSIMYHVHSGTSIEWSQSFTFYVFRNKILMHIKNSSLFLLLNVLRPYSIQVVSESIRGINTKVHIMVILSLTSKLPKFFIKRLSVRHFIKNVPDSTISRRLKRINDIKRPIKNICLYNTYLPTMGGGELLTATTIECLNKIFPDATIDILCHETETYSKPDFSGDLLDRLNKSFNSNVKNTKIVFVDFNFRNSLLKIRNFNKLSRFTKKYDIFINNTYQSPLIGKSKINIYFCMFPMRLECPNNRITKRIYEEYFNHFLYSYDLFLAISQYTQKWMDRYWDVNSYVLYPTINLNNDFSDLPRDNIILNIGRFFVGGHNKKQDILIDAFKKMCDMGIVNGWKLILIGQKHKDPISEEYTQNLEKMAESYPIYFKYSISNEELQSLLKRAKIYWHSTGFGEDLEKNPEKFEHFGLSTLEAMNSGLVPVVFNAGGQPELVDHETNGFVWNTKDELISFTKMIIEEDPLRRVLSYNAIISSKKFSKDEFFKKLCIFLDSLNLKTELSL